MKTSNITKKENRILVKIAKRFHHPLDIHRVNEKINHFKKSIKETTDVNNWTKLTNKCKNEEYQKGNVKTSSPAYKQNTRGRKNRNHTRKHLGKNYQHLHHKITPTKFTSKKSLSPETSTTQLTPLHQDPSPPRNWKLRRIRIPGKVTGPDSNMN